jgi:hypothetical protein
MIYPKPQKQQQVNTYGLCAIYVRDSSIQSSLEESIAGSPELPAIFSLKNCGLRMSIRVAEYAHRPPAGGTLRRSQ